MGSKPFDRSDSGGGSGKPQIYATGGSKGTDSVGGGTRKPRSQNGSLAVPLYGRRLIKQFPISHSELKQLTERRNTATTLLSIGTGLFGIGAGLFKDTFFSNPVKGAAVMQSIEKAGFDWPTISIALMCFGVIIFILGCWNIFQGRNMAKTIERETTFDT